GPGDGPAATTVGRRPPSGVAVVAQRRKPVRGSGAAPPGLSRGSLSRLLMWEGVPLVMGGALSVHTRWRRLGVRPKALPSIGRRTSHRTLPPGRSAHLTSGGEENRHAELLPP